MASRSRFPKYGRTYGTSNRKFLFGEANVFKKTKIGKASIHCQHCKKVKIAGQRWIERKDYMMQLYYVCKRCHGKGMY